jgi:cytochrome c oxidase subunit 1
MYSEKVGVIASIMVFIGFNATFFPQFVMGSHGSPRRWATYPVQFQPYHDASTIGAYLMASGLILVGLNWLHGALWGRKAPHNPWGGNSLEWHCPTPPPHDNFPVAPVADDPYNLSAWTYDKATQNWIHNPDAAKRDDHH